MPPTDQSNPPSFSLAQVQQQIQDAIIPLTEFEQIELSEGLNSILAGDVHAAIDVPAFDNSAMDGYAFAARDLNMHQTLNLVGRAFAGHPFTGHLQAGQAIHITTGAAIPLYADSVLPQELAVLINQTTLDMRGIPVRPGQHRRLRGEDLAQGTLALPKGTRLGPAELGLLTSLGLTHIAVQRPLKVAIFSTGDELRQPGQSLGDGAIYDSNRAVLRAMLMRFGASVVDLGILADDPAVIESALSGITQSVDVIITSGGVSAGAADFTRQVLEELGQLQFWSVNMRPGRPMAFGKINRTESSGSTCVFGLPGNPVAMMVSFYFFVRPALQLLSGSPVNMTAPVQAISSQAIFKKVGRTEFQRGMCKINSQGNLCVNITGEQSSGMLSSMTQANCLVMLSPEQENIVAGDMVKVLLFDGLM
jgi:molybdopterin molybdotransferase